MNATCHAIRVAGALLLLAGATLAAAQAYPAKPITIIQSSTAGSGPDGFLRLGATQMSESMKQPVNVESRAGGGGTVAAVAVKQATPDGYTLLFSHSGNLIMDPLLGSAPFDTVKDFKPISTAYYTVAILTVPGTSPVKTLADLVALAKSKPDGLLYGTAATSSELIVAIIAQATGTKLTAVPYKGVPQVMADVAGGRLDFGIGSPQPIVKALSDEGKMRVILMVAPKRSEQLPWPTAVESGIPLPRTLTWFGWLAPANTPDAVVRVLHREIGRAFGSPEVRDLALRQGAFLTLSESPEEFAKVIETDRVQVAKVIKETGLKASRQ